MPSHRLAQRTEGQHDSRDGGEAEHCAPGGGGEGHIDQQGCQDADADHQLADAAQGPPDVCGRHLAQPPAWSVEPHSAMKVRSQGVVSGGAPHSLASVPELSQGSLPALGLAAAAQSSAVASAADLRVPHHF